MHQKGQPMYPPCSESREGVLSVRNHASEKKNTLPLRTGGRGASTTMSSWDPGSRGHTVTLP
eukprot:8683540-Pyramimonas_sp.AAC.2